MQKKIFLSAAVLIIGALGVGGAVFAYNFVLGDTAAPSGEITAVPVQTSTETLPAPTAAVAATQPPAQATDTAQPAASLIVFQISQAGSEARFSIYEELAGQPKTVVGVTDQVAGEIAVDLGDLSKTQVGVIQVNARAFATDSDRRNRAIRNFILNTDQFEYVTFTPKQIIGLTGAAQIGQPFTFQIEGDLTIRNITQTAVFNVTVTGESQSRLSGSAVTTVQRADYQLTIPSVPNVANVGEEVTLEFDFVALATPN